MVTKHERERRELTDLGWRSLGEALFGADMKTWRFVCPVCGHVQSIASVMLAHPEMTAAQVSRWIYFSCEGRYNEGSGRAIAGGKRALDPAVGCDYTLGGLFKLNVWDVVMADGKKRPVFAFAEG